MIEVYCKKQPVGEWLVLPENWQVKNYHWEKGFVSLEGCYRQQLNAVFPSFLGIWNRPDSLQETCDIVFKEIIPVIETNFWLLYYFDYDNVCILAAEKNYFEGTEYEIVEVKG